MLCSPVYAAGLGYVFCLTVSVLSCAGGVRCGPVGSGGVYSQTGHAGCLIGSSCGPIRSDWRPIGYSVISFVSPVFDRRRSHGLHLFPVLLCYGTDVSSVPALVNSSAHTLPIESKPLKARCVDKFHTEKTL